MTYFAGSWMFALRWFLGAIFVQNHNEETEILRVSEQPSSEVWQIPALPAAPAPIDRRGGAAR
jgi:hypothetical protein